MTSSSGCSDISGNEWKTRYEIQTELNGQLERQTSLIRERMEDLRGNPVGESIHTSQSNKRRRFQTCRAAFNLLHQWIQFEEKSAMPITAACYRYPLTSARNLANYEMSMRWHLRDVNVTWTRWWMCTKTHLTEFSSIWCEIIKKTNMYRCPKCPFIPNYLCHAMKALTRSKHHCDIFTESFAFFPDRLAAIRSFDNMSIVSVKINGPFIFEFPLWC